jgi:hypothetical protein
VYHGTYTCTRESVQNSDLHRGGGVTSNKSGIQMLLTTPQIHQSPIYHLIEVNYNEKSTLVHTKKSPKLVFG